LNSTTTVSVLYIFTLHSIMYIWQGNTIVVSCRYVALAHMKFVA